MFWNGAGDGGVELKATSRLCKLHLLEDQSEL